MALTDKLTSIANAIREKGSTTAKLTLDAMPAAIAALEVGGGSGSGDEDIKLHWEGNLGKWAGNANGIWEWYFKKYGDKITTANITGLSDALQSLPTLEEIPFDFNCKVGTSLSMASAFSGSAKLKKIGKIVDCKCNSLANTFSNCSRLRELPIFENFTFDSSSSGNTARSAFSNCSSLRSVPEELLNKLGNDKATSNVYSSIFNGCYVLDEIRGLSPITGTLTSNQFSATFYNCYRLKSLVFKTKEDGSPHIVNWKNQTIEIYNGIGWLTGNNASITDLNSGITEDKKITDETNYPTLKDDPDCYTGNVYYSRFNHDSAVELINSLPDASAYLATQSGGTNTIKFRQDAGKLTDGGQIGDLTEEEIAVATAKGWTITFAA